MRILLSSVAVLALAASFWPTMANAQATGEALGEGSLQPMSITCADLTGASEEEQAGLVFFIAGYQAAMQQLGGTGSQRAGAGGAAGGAGPGGGTDTAAGAGTTTGDGAAGGGATAGGGADTAAGPGAATGGGPATTGATAGGGAGADAGGEVQVSRSFFAMDAEEILAACEGRDDELALTVITEAQAGAQ